MTHSIHPEAAAELAEAALFYARAASPAIAEAFLAEYERVRDLLIENPQRGPHLEGGLRVYAMDRFPYSVVYDEGDAASGPRLFAIAHQRRTPGYWRGRM